MKQVTKPKDLVKRKRLEEEERRTRQAIRMLCQAAGEEYPGDGFKVSQLIESVLVPRVRFLAEQARKAV